MKPETKALRFIEDTEDNLRSVVRTLDKTRRMLEDQADNLGYAMQFIEDEVGGIIAAKEILEEMRKK